MKARFATPIVTFELEASTPKDMFKLIAETQEVFGERQCGMCGKQNIRFAVRTVGGDDYYEYQCECGAKLSLGQAKAKAGHLFPIRKLTDKGKPDRKNGAYDTKCKGWTKYRGEQTPPE